MPDSCAVRGALPPKLPSRPPARPGLRLLGFGVLVLLLVGAMLGLARWQWNRAQQKQLLHDAALQLRRLPPLELSGPVPDDLPRYRHVRLRGRWVSSPLFLDNQILNGRAGYQVVMLFQPEGDQRALLVQRGWMLKTFTGDPVWTSQDAPQAELEVEMSPWPHPQPLRLQGQVVQGLQRAALMQHCGCVLHAQIGLQVAPVTAGLHSRWPAPAQEDINKHLSYAGQWLLFSILLSGVYVFYVTRYWRYWRCRPAS